MLPAGRHRTNPPWPVLLAIFGTRLAQGVENDNLHEAARVSIETLIMEFFTLHCKILAYPRPQSLRPTERIDYGKNTGHTANDVQVQ
ncbi:hypothetical protein LX36DRAFT_650652 [Colletotrichum falcatum]|nr:hypothetical protein LX36DRAFT_650652 [Colletotrichum falcatum]